MSSRFVAMGLLAFPIVTAYGCGGSAITPVTFDSFADGGTDAGGGHYGKSGGTPRDDAGAFPGDDSSDGGDDATPSGPDSGNPSPGDDTADSGTPANPGAPDGGNTLDGGNSPAGNDPGNAVDGSNSPPGNDPGNAVDGGGSPAGNDPGNTLGGSAPDAGNPAPPPPPPDPGMGCTSSVQFGGQGVAAYASGLIGLDVADTGFVQLTSSAVHRSTTGTGTVDLQALFASLDGSGSMVHALAQMATPDDNLGPFAPFAIPNLVSATLIKSESTASCNSSVPSVTGVTTITDLKIAGLAVVVDGTVNQTIAVAGVATIVINEQVPAINATHGSIVVNAIHIRRVDGTQDVVIAAALAKINCACAD